jgi:hypothetical protein
VRLFLWHTSLEAIAGIAKHQVYRFVVGGFRYRPLYLDVGSEGTNVTVVPWYKV